MGTNDIMVYNAELWTAVSKEDSVLKLIAMKYEYISLKIVIIIAFFLVLLLI